MSPSRQKPRKGKPRLRRVEPAVRRHLDDVATLSASLRLVLDRAYAKMDGLAASDSPLDAQVAASILIAGWSQLELDGQPDPAALLTLAMIGYLEHEATPDAVALLYGIMSIERRWILECVRAVGRLRDAGVVEPPWAATTRRPRLDAAWFATDVFADHDFLVGRYSFEGRAAHDIAVMVDHNILDIAKEIAIVPAAAEIRATWERAPDIVVHDLTDREYTDRLADALENLDRTWEPPVDPSVRLLRPLIESRLDVLPRPRPLKRRQVSQAARKRLYAAFIGSTHAQPLAAEARGLARVALDYAADYYDDALRWSPIVVELFLTDFLPRRITLDPDDVETLPDALRAWLRFVGEQRGFDGRLVGELLGAVAEFEGAYRDAISDPSQFGPAKSVAAQMLADGVDLTDDAAVQRWIDDFNARPFDEREAATGGPRLH